MHLVYYHVLYSNINVYKHVFTKGNLICLIFNLNMNSEKDKKPNSQHMNLMFKW